jgi:HEAT repeat protein
VNLSNADPRSRQEAAYQIAHLDQGRIESETIRHLWAAESEERDSLAKIWMVIALSRHSNETAKIRETLLTLTHDSDSSVRTLAVGELARLPIDESTIMTLADSLETEKDPYVRREIVILLGRAGEQAKAVWQQLAFCLTDEGTDVQMFAAEALGNIGPDAHRALPNLLRVAMEKNAPDDVRLAAIRAIGKLGTKAQAALPELHLIASRSDKIGAEATAAIKRLTSK